MEANQPQPVQAQPEYVDVYQGAALIQISHWTLRSWLSQGRLRRYKVGGRTLVDKNELLRLVHLDT